MQNNRIEMNTKSLQKHFSSVYKDFFARNDLVLSGCFCFPWGPSGVGERSNYVITKSKIPLKCYVGFKKVNKKGITFNNVNFFNLTSTTFESYEYSKVNKNFEQIIKFLNDFLEKNNYLNGIEIEFLSETSRGHSFGFTGTSVAITSVGLYLLLGKLENKYYEKYNEFLNSDIFKEIESFAIDINSVSKKKISLGQNIRHTFHNNSDPSFLISGKSNNSEIIVPKFLKISEMCGDNFISSDVLFDYYMIFSGIPTDTNQIINYIKGNEKKYKDYSNFIKEFILGDRFDGLITNFDKYLKDEDLVYKNLNENLNILGIKTIELFKEIFENSYNENLISEFIENINNYNNAVSLIEKQSLFVDDFKNLFNLNKTSFEEKIGIMPAYSGKFGGGYVVVTKNGISRETIIKVINQINNVYPNTAIEYSSYIDGECSDGVVIEQFINEGIYSNYVDKNKLVYRDNKGNNYIGEYSDIIEKENSGLLFDMINNKIYFNGEKLTSKDIPSQNTTIDVITRLLENVGIEISNKDLPNSSYSSNKNEMLGKIISPLIRFIEENTKEKLNIVCSGSIGDFYIKMGEINLKIGAIKKLI